MSVSMETVERMWTESFEDLARDMAAGNVGSDHFEVGRAIMDARVALEQRDAADKTAKSTRHLVWATGLLVLAAVAQVVTIISLSL